MTGILRSSRAFATLKTAAVAPTPRAREAMATARPSLVSPQHAQGVRDVANESFEHWQPAAVAPGLSGRADAAELHQRLPPRLFGAHAGANAIFDVQLDVGLDLRLEFLFVLRAAKHALQTQRPRPQRSHDGSLAWSRNWSRMSVVRCHSSDARASRFFPARVSS